MTPPGNAIDHYLTFTTSYVLIYCSSKAFIASHIHSHDNIGTCCHSCNTGIYRKQQILCSTKLLRFSRIFDKTRKFSLLISMAHSNMYCNLTKPRQFSLHSAKNQWTAKVLYRGGFVVYGNITEHFSDYQYISIDTGQYYISISS